MVVFYWMLAACVGLLPVTAFACGMLGIFFTKLESGNIKYIYHGDTLWRIIADVRGRKIEGDKLIPGKEVKTGVDKFLHPLGLYWVGLPGVAEVKKFRIQKKRENEITAGKPSSEWIKDMGTEEVDSLRAYFPRPFLLSDVELGDRQTVNLMVVAKFAVVDAYIPVPELKGDFFGNTSSTLRAAIDDILKGFATMDDFIVANKGEGGILSVLENDPVTSEVSAFNQALEKQVGLHLTGGSIPEWDPSDKKVRDAMNAKFIAEKQAEAVAITAEAYKTRVGIETEADAARVRDMATAAGSRVKAVRENLEVKGASADVVVEAAAEVLCAEAQPNLSTRVKGAAAVVVGGK